MVQELLDSLTDGLLHVLVSSARKHCGEHKERIIEQPRPLTPSRDSVLRDLRERRSILLRRLSAPVQVEEVRALDRQALKRVNREYARRVRQLEREAEKEFYDALEGKPIAEQQRIIKFARNGRQRSGARMLVPDRLPDYSRHFESMVSRREGFRYDDDDDDASRTTSAESSDDATETTDILCESEYATVSVFFSPPIIEHFVRGAPNGKAAGCSGVPAEMMKPVAGPVARTLSLIGEVMFRTGLCPDAFKRANITPVPKKGNSDDIRDFRPISLTEIPRRILEKCLALHLQPFQRALSPMQGGFREHRSTMDQAAVLQHILSTRHRHRGPPQHRKSTIVAFLDIKAAYDSVDRQLLWGCCARMGIPDWVIGMLRGMFDHNRSRVVIGGCEGEWFRNRVGLLQGSSLSPLLYAIFIDELPKQLLRHFPSLPFGDGGINAILYADDIALVAESFEVMQGMLDYCTVYAHQHHFLWGTHKCEVLLSRIHDDPPRRLSLQGEYLKVCESFKYLGIVFNQKGIDTNACVQRLCKSIGDAGAALVGMGLMPQRYPLHTIASHFRVFVRSCGEYALGILCLGKDISRHWRGHSTGHSKHWCKSGPACRGKRCWR